jgi:hypothetical protein
MTLGRVSRPAHRAKTLSALGYVRPDGSCFGPWEQRCHVIRKYLERRRARCTRRPGGAPELDLGRLRSAVHAR